MRSLVRIRLVFEELHLEASGITHPIPATGRQRGIWGVLSSFSTKGSNCVNKRWSRNVQCRVTWDNGACRSLKTQLKHMCAYINTDYVHKCPKMTSSPPTHPHTHKRGIVSHSARAVPSIQSANISLQRIIKMERPYILSSCNDASFNLKSWAGDPIVSEFSPVRAELGGEIHCHLVRKERQMKKRQYLENDGRFGCLMTSSNSWWWPAEHFYLLVSIAGLKSLPKSSDVNH